MNKMGFLHFVLFTSCMVSILIGMTNDLVTKDTRVLPKTGVFTLISVGITMLVVFVINIMKKKIIDLNSASQVQLWT